MKMNLKKMLYHEALYFGIEYDFKNDIEKFMNRYNIHYDGVCTIYVKEYIVVYKIISCGDIRGIYNMVQEEIQRIRKEKNNKGSRK